MKTTLETRRLRPRSLRVVLFMALPPTAFSLIELLVVMVIIAILAAVLLPALASAKARGQSIACLSNLRQLQNAWLMYVHDNSDVMPPNVVLGIGREAGAGSWVQGNAQLDVTASNLQEGVLYSYAGSAGIYRCPADTSTVASQPAARRTRGYSSNWWLNGYGDSPSSPNPATDSEDKSKLSQLASPPPSQVFVFIDEQEQSIDDGTLVVSSDRDFPDNRDLWWDLPADRHNRGCNLAFADGHVVRWRWRWPKRMSGHFQHVANQSDYEDLYRLKACSIPDP